MTEIANTITPYSWFYPLYIHASETNDNILPSKLEILFLLDTGASISVLNLPTFHVISKQLNTILQYRFCRSKYQIQHSWNTLFQKAHPEY